MLIRSFLIPCINLPGNYKLATIIRLDRLLVMLSLSPCCKEWFVPEATELHLCKWPTVTVKLAIKKNATLNRHAQSIKHRSLFLYDLFLLGSSEIHVA